MKAFAMSLALTGIGIGWVVVAKNYAGSGPSPIDLAPIYHAPYDSTAIARNIALHKGRVARDPHGAIGWAMLSGAYLAKSREKDDDQSSWAAEDAARRSLMERRRGNVQGSAKLVQALLEQHRFQDALVAVDEALRISPGSEEDMRLRADILIEMGRLEEAEKQLASCVEVPNDPSVMAIKARIYAARGNHDRALVTLLHARSILDGMSQIGEETLAWYDVKIGNELLALHRPMDAFLRYQSALGKAPASYKARIGLAEASLAQGDLKAAVIWCDATLKLVRSYKAMAIRGEALEKSGNMLAAKRQYAEMHALFLDEDARYAKNGHGGPLGVRHPDREFATFCAKKQMFLADGLRAAKRDLQNRPDELAKSNLAKIESMLATH